uniref:C2H2-type domain-containing protein n=1 Tax=Steinernema glaseri TaxID=37863 RepID=A0A1I7ZKJ4_9BILA
MISPTATSTPIDALCARLFAPSRDESLREGIRQNITTEYIQDCCRMSTINELAIFFPPTSQVFFTTITGKDEVSIICKGCGHRSVKMKTRRDHVGSDKFACPILSCNHSAIGLRKVCHLGSKHGKNIQTLDGEERARFEDSRSDF